MPPECLEINVINSQLFRMINALLVGSYTDYLNLHNVCADSVSKLFEDEFIFCLNVTGIRHQATYQRVI